MNTGAALTPPVGHPPDMSAPLLKMSKGNTAPAVALAAFAAREQHAHALPLALPSDHLIADQRAFQVAVNTALPLAAAGELVTFGISPREPATGFGCTPPPRGPHNSAETMIRSCRGSNRGG